MNNTTLFDISLYNGKYSDFLLKIHNPASKTLVFTPNPEIFVRANGDEEFMNILKKATYNVPDGNGLYVGYMLLEGKSFLRAVFETFFMKKSVREKYGDLIKGSDLTRDILTSSLTLFLQEKGNKEGSKNNPLSENQREVVGSKRKILIIDKKIIVPRNDLERKKQELQKNMKSRLEEKYPFVQIYGVFAEEVSPKDISQIVLANQIEYVFSCIGMKAQEKLLVDIFDYLPDDQKVVGLGVGASIDFLMGIQKRAPKIFQDLGLEWFYRLITQPRIRAKRIWDAVVEFPRMVKY